MEDQLAMLDSALEAARPDQRQRLIGEFTRATESRLRFYDAAGRKVDDSFAHAPPTYTLRDPELQPWKRDAARAMDRGIDWIVGAPTYPDFEEPLDDRAAAWPEVVEALRSGVEATRFRYAPERTPLLSATRVVDLETPEVMLMTLNARDITRTVRAERFRLGGGDGDGAGRIGAAVAVPGAHDPSAHCAGWRARRCASASVARARSSSRACRAAATRSAPLPAR